MLLKTLLSDENKIMPTPLFNVRIAQEHHPRMKTVADRLRTDLAFADRLDRLLETGEITIDRTVTHAVREIEQARDAALATIHKKMLAGGTTQTGRRLTAELAAEIIDLASQGMSRRAVRKAIKSGGSLVDKVTRAWVAAGRPQDATAVITGLMEAQERGRQREVAGTPLADREQKIEQARRMRSEGLSLAIIAEQLEVSPGWVGNVTRRAKSTDGDR